MAGHTNLSRIAKVEAATIAALREGRPIAVPKHEALRQFAAKVARQRGVVSEADVAPFKAAGHGNRAVLDVLVLAATKLISNYTNHLAHTLNGLLHEGRRMDGTGQTEASRLTGVPRRPRIPVGRSLYGDRPTSVLSQPGTSLSPASRWLRPTQGEERSAELGCITRGAVRQF
jgi:hypothetical protein